MMLRCTSSVPPAMRDDGAARTLCAQRASRWISPGLTARAGDRHAEVRRAPHQQRSCELADRALGTGRLAGSHRGAGALPDEAHDPRADVDVGDALTHDGVGERPAPTGEIDERLDAAASSAATTGADGDALVHQHGDRAPPPVVDVADPVGVGDADVGEEHLVEPRARRSSAAAAGCRRPEP